MNKVFTHIKSGRLYEVIGVARCAKNSNIKKVVYKLRRFQADIFGDDVL